MGKLSTREKFFCLISNDPLRKSDAIVVLEGDGWHRIPEGARLFKEGWAPRIVLSGGIQNPPHSLPASEMLPEVLKYGIPQSAVLLEEKSLNTREQAEEVLSLARQQRWKILMLVASHYHQYRAYLTFLKVLLDSGRNIFLINAPARNLPWYSRDMQGRRVDLLEGEFERIEEYRLKGHVASYEEALEYQEWKEALG